MPLHYPFSAVVGSDDMALALTLTAVSGGGVEVAVADRTHEPVTIAGEDGGGHRGLVLVDALSESWGVDQTPDGKRVWAVVGPRTA